MNSVANNYHYLGQDSLARLWDNIKEYYSSDINSIHIGDNTTATTRDINADGTDNIATTKYVKDLVLDTLTGGLAAIPVVDVEVNGESVLDNRTAKVDIPITTINVKEGKVVVNNRTAYITLPVTDIQVKGESIVQDGIATIEYPDAPIQSISINGNKVEVTDSNVDIAIPTISVAGNIKEPIDNVIDITASDLGVATEGELGTLSSRVDNIGAQLTQQALKDTALEDSLNNQSDKLQTLTNEFNVAENRLNSLATSIGRPNGLATLDTSGKLARSQMPDLPYEVYDTQSSLPETGEAGIIYVIKDSGKLLTWDGKAYTAVEGTDKEAEKTINEHVANTENPHKVTKDQIGLDLVDNTADLDKPVSRATQEELDSKVNVADVVDSLISPSKNRPLSAYQGRVLNGKISDTSKLIESLGSVLRFKGVLHSLDELRAVEDPKQGDAYQIRIINDDGTEQDDSGVVYAYNGNAWVAISVSISDISASIASTEEVYQIIENYGG